MGTYLRAGVLHYHLRHGGVRTVLTNALKSLIRYGAYRQLEIDIITGDARQPSGDELVRDLIEWARFEGPIQARFSQIEIPGLGYNQKPAQDQATLEKNASYLCERLIVFMDLDRSSDANPYILHAHNANLGKNPTLTLALKLLVKKLREDDLPAVLLYQMHDFAEDHRPDCWRALRDCTGKSDADYAAAMMYPAGGGSRLHWAVINSGDKEALASLGINPTYLNVLPDCVAVDQFTAKPLMAMTDGELKCRRILPVDFAGILKKRIDQYSRDHGFAFSPERKILLCPVKAIRRKNIIEAILLMLALNTRNNQYQLLVTLPPGSASDIEYCRSIEDMVRQENLPVTIGFGCEAIRPGASREVVDGKVLEFALVDLLAISDCVVTTSFQEGFGYVFHEPWLAGKAVVGRDIPRVTRDFINAGLQLQHLYRHLYVPFTWLEELWPEILDCYVEKIIAMHEEMALPTPDEEQLRDCITSRKIVEIVSESRPRIKMIDFADLNLSGQLHIVRKMISRPENLAGLHYDYPGMEVDRISCGPIFPDEATIEHNKRIICEKYSLPAQAGLLKKIYSELSGKISDMPDSQQRIGSNEPLFKLMYSIERTRLLV